jgi:hypothetical protein
MSEHVDPAGNWARNSRGQLVSAKDKKRVFKGTTHTYYCVCLCGDTVTLRRGEEREAHFAYKAHRRNGCTGNACKETEIHYNAKWLLSDIFQQINFWRVCGCNHRITKKQYTGPWTATVEKQIPGTTRIADVLLENSCTKEAVALEVYHTHGVGMDKKTECELAGVTIIEVEATHVVHGVEVVAITPDCRDLHNELNQYERGECGECEEEDRVRRERFKAYCARKDKEEHDRREREELKKEQLRDKEEHDRREREVKQEQLREQTIAMELQNAAQQEIRARAREEREREEVRHVKKPRPLTLEEQRVHKMRLEYKRMNIPVNF